MVNLDLRPSEVNIQFLRGSTLACTFYYLDAAGVVVDLSGYTGSFRVFDPVTFDIVEGWPVDLTIVTGITTFNELPVLDAQGVYLEVPSSVTARVSQDYLNYECLLIDASLRATPIAYGTLEPSGICLS